MMSNRPPSSFHLKTVLDGCLFWIGVLCLHGIFAMRSVYGEEGSGFRHTDSKVRDAAYEEFHSSKGQEKLKGFSELVKIMGEKDPTTTPRAEQAIGLEFVTEEKWVEENMPTLKSMLMDHVNDADPETKRKYLKFIRRLKPESRDVDVIATVCLTGANSDLRLSLLPLLDGFKLDEKIRIHWIECLKYPETRKAAIKTIAQWDSIPPPVLRAIVQYGAAGENVTASTIFAKGGFEDTEYLKELIEHSEEYIRAWALAGLETKVDQEKLLFYADKILKRKIEDRDLVDAIKAIEILCRLAPSRPKIIERILSMLKDRRMGFHCHQVRANLLDPARVNLHLPIYIAGLRHGSESVRKEVCEIIRRLKGQASALEPYLTENFGHAVAEVRMAASEAYGAVFSESPEKILILMDHHNPLIRLGSLEALLYAIKGDSMNLQNPASLRFPHNIPTVPREQWKACIPRIAKLREDPDERVRSAVVEILRTISILCKVDLSHLSITAIDNDPKIRKEENPSSVNDVPQRKTDDLPHLPIQKLLELCRDGNSKQYPAAREHLKKRLQTPPVFPIKEILYAGADEDKVQVMSILNRYRETTIKHYNRTTKTKDHFLSVYGEWFEDLADHSSSEVRREAHIALVGNGHSRYQSPSVLIENLKTMKDSESKIHLAEVIGQLGWMGKEAVPVLLAQSQTGGNLSRKAAIRTLGKLGPVSLPGYLPIKKIAKDLGEDVDIRFEAVKAAVLINPEDKAFLQEITSMIISENQRVRAIGCEALLSLPKWYLKEVIEEIISAVIKSKSPLDSSVEDLLIKTGDQGCRSLFERLILIKEKPVGPSSAPFKALAKMSEYNTSVLLNGLKNDQLPVRKTAVHVAGVMAEVPQKIGARLEEMVLSEKDDQLRGRVAELVVSLKSKGVNRTKKR